MLDEMVVSDTVNPTDWELTSQKHTSLPQVLEDGKNAIQAAETVHRILATEAVIKRAGKLESVYPFERR